MWKDSFSGIGKKYIYDVLVRISCCVDTSRFLGRVFFIIEVISRVLFVDS